ncbi:glucosyl-3-phosphoglycerate synthase [Salinactinospora qingdaonensis]|uniref:Glucosyl-3-phosphoglycerate synthase n=2 Tax=Salinactinospora qingdaonensis TaxID=702744 RepID=A0ABP7FRA2_9ACTN
MSGGWFERRTRAWSDWTVEQLVKAKQQADVSVSLVIPARDEAATVGGIVSRVHTDLVVGAPLLDEIIVMDSDSSDATAERAAHAGATVHRVADVRPDVGHHRGKGEAMWKSLFVASGEIIAFMDADLVEWDTHFVTGILGPLLTDRDVALVKGFYDRLLDQSGQVHTAGTTYEGGRVTELVARPTIALRWPELASVIQPLSGEWAVRRSLFEALPVPTGYGVEFGVLVDTYLRAGMDAIAQVDLGRRAHRHQPLRDLGAMATELLAVADRRAGVSTHPEAVEVRQFGTGEQRRYPITTMLSIAERPPAGRLAAPPSQTSCPPPAQSGAPDRC